MLALSRRLEAELKGLARAAMPLECCGALLGSRDGGRRVARSLRPARNIAVNPAVEYVMHPDDLLGVLNESERAGPHGRLLGFYHSHPFGPDGPSATDRARASWDGFLYVVYSVTSDRLGAWAWDAQQRTFRGELVTVDDGGEP